ncbi:CAP domain-containing protein, partial [Anaerotruncus colihominis]
QWETWLAEAFNEYRQISGFVQDSKAEGKEPVIGVGSLIESKEDFDAEALALEAFSLINEARTENGLHEVVLDEEAMELAKMRVPELEERYGHTRPDGTRMSQTYRCAEIINRRASTPQIAVESWLDSPAHREIILDERYHSAGVACRKGADGVTYWCMLFYK